MTTHILEVAERMADRIGVIARRPADRRGHARRAAPGQAGRAAHASLEDTFLALVAEQARRRERIPTFPCACARRTTKFRRWPPAGARTECVAR